MKFLFSLLLIGFTSANIFAQSKTSNYAAAVSFNSKCCGVPDAMPLYNSIAAFKKVHKIKKVSYDKIGPLGKEGEFMLGFELKEFTKKQKTMFIKLLKQIVPTLKSNTDEASSGTANLLLNEPKFDLKSLGRITIVTENI